MKSEVKRFAVFVCIVGGSMMLATSAGSNPPEREPSTNIKPVDATVNPSKNTSCTGNETDCGKENHSFVATVTNYFSNNWGMVMRSFYVLIGVTGIVIVYFIIRTVRLRRRSKSKKYGIIATSGSDNLEMTPLDQDDDDEDLTVFEVNGRR